MKLAAEAASHGLSAQEVPARDQSIPPTPQDRLIVALDYPDAHSALTAVDRLDGLCKWFKVGLELYLAAGNSIVESLKRHGFSVFLDLKLHDIPNTVAGAVRSATACGADLLTIHASGGPAMLAAAAEAASAPHAPKLLAVTVLTSMDQRSSAQPDLRYPRQTGPSPRRHRLAVRYSRLCLERGRGRHFARVVCGRNPCHSRHSPRRRGHRRPETHRHARRSHRRRSRFPRRRTPHHPGTASCPGRRSDSPRNCIGNLSCLISNPCPLLPNPCLSPLFLPLHPKPTPTES